MSYVCKITDDTGVTGPIGSALYGSCTTAAATAAKVATVTGFDTLITGVTIHVKFQYSNTAASATLNVNSTGAKPIYRYGTTAVGTTVDTSWGANGVVSLTYDGTGWMLNDHIANTNTDTKVTQTNTTENAEYRVLFSNTASDSTLTEGARKSTNLRFNPSTGILTATEFSGLLSEDNITWGKNNINAGFAVTDAGFNTFLSANRFSGARAAGITIEYSTNGGSTWITYPTTDEDKQMLFTDITDAYRYRAGGPTGAAGGANNRLRITVDTQLARVYTLLKKFHIYVTTNGSDNSTCTIDVASHASPTVWREVSSGAVDGWSGWNIRPVSFYTYATPGNPADTNIQYIRFTFAYDGLVDSKYATEAYGLQVIGIQGFGGVGWITPTQMGSNGHAYTFDSNMNVTFPGTVTGTNFIGTINGHSVATDVPSGAKFTDTTYTAGTGLSLSGTTFNHSNSVTAVTTAGLLKVKYDAQGHITGTTAVAKADITGLGIPAQDTTYSAEKGITLTSGKFGHSNTAITALTTASLKKIAYDAYGHITSTANVTASDLPSHTHSYAGSSTAGGTANTAYKLIQNGTSRPTSANLTSTYDRSLSTMIASSLMTTGKPMSDGYITTFNWDNSSPTNDWQTQLYLPAYTYDPVISGLDGIPQTNPQYRMQMGDWATSNWIDFLVSNRGVGKDRYIAYPTDGMFTAKAASPSTETVTGALVITLPFWYSNTMIAFTVAFYNWATNTSAEYRIYGYCRTTASIKEWRELSAVCYGIGTTELAGNSSSKANLTVRFGDNGSKLQVQIGETNTVWKHPNVVVKDIILGYANSTSYDYHTYRTGWDIGFQTTNIAYNYQGSTANKDVIIYNTNITGRSILYDADSNTGTTISNIPTTKIPTYTTHLELWFKSNNASGTGTKNVYTCTTVPYKKDNANHYMGGVVQINDPNDSTAGLLFCVMPFLLQATTSSGNVSFTLTKGKVECINGTTVSTSSKTANLVRIIACP